MMSSKNKGSTASDIERYHSGKMLPEERHALEKAALDDPFLADALEGYTFTSTPSHDLANIRSRLDEKLNRKKVVPIFQKYRWLSVAAILLIIAGTAWLAYNMPGKEDKNFTALERKVQDKDSKSIVASPQNKLNDSTTKKINVAGSESATNEGKVADKKTNDAISGFASTKPTGIAANKKETGQNDNSETVSKAISQPSQNEVATANGRAFNMPKSKVATPNRAFSAQPQLNEVVVVTNQKDLGKKADSNNNFTSRVSSIATNDTIKDLNIVLQPLPHDSLKEIVIGYGKAKTAAEKYPRVVIDTLEPAEGYVQFDDYIASNLKMPEELKSKSVSGEVQLSFDVDKEGQATNIAVVKSLCQKCDEEAIRLLKEGPKWKQKKNKKGRITIKF